MGKWLQKPAESSLVSTRANGIAVYLLLLVLAVPLTLRIQTDTASLPSAPFLSLKLFGKKGTISRVNIGRPLSFLLRKNASASARVVMSHAIPVPEEGYAVFVVYDRFPGTGAERIFALPPEYACVYRDENVAVEVLTKLEMFRTNDGLHKTTSIWRCPFPSAKDSTKYSSVRVVGPPAASMQGDSVFLLQPTEELGEVTACMKNLYSIRDNFDRILEYVDHYRRLGVSHFISYVEENERDVELLDSVPGLTVVVLPRELRVATFGPQKPRPGPMTAKLQIYTTLDCVWRTRYRSAWTMIQFDLDELLVGTNDLVETLRRIPESRAGVYVRHRIVRPPYASQPMLRNGIQFTSKSPPTWGKTIIRPEQVDVQVCLAVE
jgi:Glycosyltransferase family 92